MADIAAGMNETDKKNDLSADPEQFISENPLENIPNYLPASSSKK